VHGTLPIFSLDGVNYRIFIAAAVALNFVTEMFNIPVCLTKRGHLSIEAPIIHPVTCTATLGLLGLGIAVIRDNPTAILAAQT